VKFRGMRVRAFDTFSHTRFEPWAYDPNHLRIGLSDATHSFFFHLSHGKCLLGHEYMAVGTSFRSSLPLRQVHHVEGSRRDHSGDHLFKQSSTLCRNIPKSRDTLQESHQDTQVHHDSAQTKRSEQGSSQPADLSEQNRRKPIHHE
jgi:hypothetical protein